MNYIINMKARDGSDVTLTQKEVDDTEEILGMWQAPINDGKKANRRTEAKSINVGKSVPRIQMGKNKGCTSSKHQNHERSGVSPRSHNTYKNAMQ